jgi:hypothetical protein
MRKEEVLCRIKGKKNILDTRKENANWIGRTLRKNYIRKDRTDGKRGIKRKQLLHNREGKEKILERNTKWQCAENWFW